MKTHALLSASSSQRWLSCTPSVRLEESFKNEESSFAAEGSAAHNMAEHKVRGILGQDSTKPVSKYDGDDLEYYTDMYGEFVTEMINEAKAKCKDPIILLEQKLDYSKYVEGGFGTGDLVIVADETLDILDLKYGQGIRVSAVDNPQMKLYALGALNLFESLYDIKNVRMTIFQPRLDNISTFELTVDELIDWAENELKPKAQLAFNGEGNFVPGDYCRFCRAKSTCRARADELMELVKYEFKNPDLLEDYEIEDILPLTAKLASWGTDIFSYALKEAIKGGKKWKGFKLVEGRGIRKYSDDDEVIKTLNNAGYKDIYKKSLLGITAMEKLLGKKQFTTILGNLVTKQQGQPTLVPNSDKRNEIKNTAELDFKEDFNYVR